ncbi:Acetyl-/propionyl-coenzyme A carboxylase alpha chain [bacterium HR40]|nr:Acetyl-/propionyl-coenzyme A carboxylase alpha chain [bacterium HR40]
MFSKILIANRGEIACRIIRTCRAHGIRTVAVYSDADRDALHVEMADEAVRLGPPPSRESYLAIDRIVEACRRTGAEAVHPGYGFLAENPILAEVLAAEGIVFIGPPVEAIRLMGDKIESKRLARRAGVPTIPGSEGALASFEEVLETARAIGFPVMLKAAAGGGGKGMRIARNESELLEGFERARSEALSAFGDDRVFLEKYVVEPRHIEVQVLADRYGKVVYLGERECSIQRRHQKVIEEAPSPFLDEATRQAMGERACALARAVGYVSAGTVEFVVDRDRNFYFLEMNTRLQVEHPVTELVTGRDLVWDMIRIAAGEPLGFEQEEVRLRGWAIEARLYAEDPARGFLPAVGRLRRYREPRGEGIRIDSGVVEGSEIPIFYDPMIAKICAFGPDRETAADRLATALDAFVVRGPQTNLDFLRAVVDHPRFRAGRLSTGFIAEEFGERFAGVELPPERRRLLAAAAALMAFREAERALRIGGRLPGVVLAPERRWWVSLGSTGFPATIEADGGTSRVRIADEPVDLSLDWLPGRLLARIEAGKASLFVQVDRICEGFRLRHGGAVFEALVRTERAAEYAARMPQKPPRDSSREVAAPMPGLIVSVAVRPGQEVEVGQELLVLEAMKMENVLRAERSGIVAEVRVRPRDAVAADQVLLVFA